MLRFRDEALAAHQTDHVDLVFANAAIGGGGSFINDPREQWERVFAVNWWGVYYTARAFLPLLIASPEGVLVNTSSVNGFWATLGPAWPHTAYSTAKFAVKGFTESLIEDLRANAPHVRVVLVMPGYIATNIVGNSMLRLRLTDTAEIEKANAGWREAPRPRPPRRPRSSSTGCGPVEWRVLVGEDAKQLDEFVRANPASTYDHAERAKTAASLRGGHQERFTSAGRRREVGDGARAATAACRQRSPARRRRVRRAGPG